jgi:hypothetical protein
MKYKEAMASSDRDKWQKAVDEEHERMLKHNMWKPVLRKDVPEGTKILMLTWAMKKKANGTYHARMNARGYEQVDGKHYDKMTKAAPVANEITIRMQPEMVGRHESHSRDPVDRKTRENNPNLSWRKVKGHVSGRFG